MKTNILFTSVGRRVELLRSFRKAYRTLGITGHIIALDVDPLAPALRLADVPYVAPRLDCAEYIPTLLDILKRYHVAAVFPLIDPDIPLLAGHQEVLEATGARLVVVSSEAAEIAGDKWRTNDLFHRLGVPAPRSWLPGQVDPLGVEYPLFIKPRFGSASQQTFRTDSPKEFSFFSEYLSEPIIQEYLPGPEITNDVICDLDGSVLSVVSRQRIRVRDGEVRTGKTIFSSTIADNCVRIAEALPALGPITVQCIMKAGTPMFTEINARFAGGVPLSIAAGANGPLWLLARVAGVPVKIPPLGCYRRGLYLSRFDESFFVSQAERDEMTCNHPSKDLGTDHEELAVADQDVVESALSSSLQETRVKNE